MLCYLQLLIVHSKNLKHPSLLLESTRTAMYKFSFDPSCSSPSKHLFLLVLHKPWKGVSCSFLHLPKSNVLKFDVIRTEDVLSKIHVRIETCFVLFFCKRALAQRAP